VNRRLYWLAMPLGIYSIFFHNWIILKLHPRSQKFNE